MPSQLRIFVLGAARFERSDGMALAFPGPKAAAVLACLAASPSLRMARTELVGLLWGDLSSTSAARHALRQCLLRLRGALGDAADLLGADAESLWLEESRVEIDLMAVRAALKDRDGPRIRDLSASVGGTFCDGLEVKAPEFEDWLRQRRSDAERLCALLHDRAAAELAAVGRMTEALEAAHRRVAVEPYEETAHAALFALCLRAGRRQAAVRARDACIELFRRDLDIRPGVESWPSLTPLVDQPRLPATIPPSRLYATMPRGNLIRAGLLGVFAIAFLLPGSPEAPLGVPEADVTAAPAMQPWITAASAKAMRQVGTGGAAREDEADADMVSRTAVRKMLEGDTDYAMLYPVGC
ncbi:AfsR/SARP family transcriptional regulator [Paracoccus marinaquae]|uniref:Bacterial transcriptional activator domain-containing protein n=1 Tax=Paracoccus marinaquae TaxID=2841926 RepID=A0ABS6AML9_9RHOB|nr:BTAD domain-containing putative transcriptional regulator [Paracoccus marinaquae]MBU3031838.1 hypothetical protein [Paracoccus marinaquae]